MEELIEKIKKEYQKKLNDDYRRANRNNSMVAILTEEELAVLNPLSEELFIAMIASEKFELIGEKVELTKSILEDEEILNDPETRSDELSEIRNDINSAKYQIYRLEDRYYTLSRVYNFLRKDEERESPTPSK